MSLHTPNGCSETTQADGVAVDQSTCCSWCRRSVISSSAVRAWRSSQASPGSWHIRATCSPAASRSPMTAITWRLAAASAPTPRWGAGQPGPHLRPGHHRVRASAIATGGRQLAHISTETVPDPVERPAGGPAERAAFCHRFLARALHAAAALLLLLVATTLAIYKPRGLTRYGQRTHHRQRKLLLP
jgi:hypothetical protein